MPPLPKFAWTQAPEANRHVTKVIEECNWLQALEGGIDTSHAPILHRLLTDSSKRGGIKPSNPFVRGKAPKLVVDITDYGYQYAGIRPLDVDYPFDDDGRFMNKVAKVYRFKLQKPVTTLLVVTVDAGTSAQCRLYKLDSGTSFALEYYTGHMQDNTCSMRVSLSNGDYQLEVTPKDANISYKLSSTVVQGDGNDGFREANVLVKGKPVVGNLEAGDYGEFYTFKLTAQDKMTVEVDSAENLRCVIFPMSDVDLFGFNGPACGAQYDYPPGTYYVGVMRLDERSNKASFSIRTQ